MFGTNNRPANSIFGNTTQQPQNSIFGGNQQQQPQQQQGNNIFGGNQPQQQQQQGGGMFNNQQQGTNPVFGNQQQQQPNTIYGNNQANQQRPNVFGGNQQQQGGNIFGGNQQQQQQQQQGNPVFGNQQQQQGVNIFGNQQQQGGNIIGNNPQQQQGGNIFGNQQQQNPQMINQMSWPPMHNSTQDVRLRIKACCERVDPKNLEHIKLDEMNMFKDQRIGELPNELKDSLKILMNNMVELRKLIDSIKLQNDTLNKQAEDYCTKVQQKLVKYKQVLIQNIQQSNLLQDVRKEVDLIKGQVTGVIIPLYNAHSTGRHQTFDSPDEFSATIARRVLEKMIQLNNKVDEIISCQQQSDSDELSEQDANTLMVLEQLLGYYENVSAKVLEFTNRYSTIKQVQIEKSRRTASYEEVMRRIQDKVKTKMDKDFKCYDLIKEIEEILAKREKREEEFREKNPDKSRYLRYNEDYSQGWGRYGGMH